MDVYTDLQSLVTLSPEQLNRWDLDREPEEEGSREWLEQSDAGEAVTGEGDQAFNCPATPSHSLGAW